LAKSPTNAAEKKLIKIYKRKEEKKIKSLKYNIIEVATKLLN
jgi:hypothetical protein